MCHILCVQRNLQILHSLSLFDPATFSTFAFEVLQVHSSGPASLAAALVSFGSELEATLNSSLPPFHDNCPQVRIWERYWRVFAAKDVRSERLPVFAA